MKGKPRTSSSSSSTTIPGVGDTCASPKQEKEEFHDGARLFSSLQGKHEKMMKKIMIEGDKGESLFVSRAREQEWRENADDEASLPYGRAPAGSLHSRSLSSPALKGQGQLESEETKGDRQRTFSSSSIEADGDDSVTKHLEEDSLSDPHEAGARGLAQRQRRREVHHQAVAPSWVSDLDENEEEDDRILSGEGIWNSRRMKASLQLREKKERDERTREEELEKKVGEIEKKKKEDASLSSVSTGRERELSVRNVDEENGFACRRGNDDKRSIQSEPESFASSQSRTASSPHGCRFFRKGSSASFHRPSSSLLLSGRKAAENRARRDTSDRGADLDEEDVAMKEEDDLRRLPQQRKGSNKDDTQDLERNHIAVSIESEEGRARSPSSSSSSSMSTFSSSTYPACRCDDVHRLSDASSPFSLRRHREFEPHFSV